MSVRSRTKRRRGKRKNNSKRREKREKNVFTREKRKGGRGKRDKLETQHSNDLIFDESEGRKKNIGSWSNNKLSFKIKCKRCKSSPIFGYMFECINCHRVNKDFQLCLTCYLYFLENPMNSKCGNREKNHVFSCYVSHGGRIKLKNIEHKNVSCNSCDVNPIKGMRFKCCDCRNSFDFCETCYIEKKFELHHNGKHTFKCILKPTEDFVATKNWSKIKGKFPIDCLTLIISFLSCAKTVTRILNSAKFVRDYCEKNFKLESLCGSIVFKMVRNVEREMKFVSKIYLNYYKRELINFGSFKYFPNLRKIKIKDFVLRGKIFEYLNPNLQHLEMIDCRGIDLTEHNKKSKLANLTNLKFLHLESNHYNMFVKCSLVDRLKGLEVLILGNVSFVKGFPQKLPELRIFKFYNVSCNSGVEEKPIYFGGFPKLEVIVLDRCPQLGLSLRHSFLKLKHLRIVKSGEIQLSAFPPQFIEELGERMKIFSRVERRKRVDSGIRGLFGGRFYRSANNSILVEREIF